MNVISIKNLSKDFDFPVKNHEVGWFKNLINPQIKKVVAVSDISFEVKKGERIAFIGPNGAGKSTTIKMMTGILFPTSGKISILGLDPSKDRKKLAYKIGTVFGQRSQLIANLPLTDSLEFFGVMYDMTTERIKERITELTKIFNLEEFIDQPVRKLSLGQRMRAEIAASLMHNPEIIFLDEPTIGLDVVAKKALRDLLIKINTEGGVTIFLTSHDAGDIESLCDRTIIINYGVIIKDLPTEDLSKTFLNEKYIDIIPNDKFEIFPTLPDGIEYQSQDSDKITIRIKLAKTSVKDALKKLLDIFDIADINVYYADLESVIRNIYERDSTGN